MPTKTQIKSTNMNSPEPSPVTILIIGVHAFLSHLIEPQKYLLKSFLQQSRC